MVLLGAVTFTMTAIKSAEAAEQAKTQTGDAWRKKPPAATPPRPFKLPAIKTLKLENGLTVQMVEDHRVPFITVNLGIKAGSSLEAPELRGLASMTADMISEGTGKRNSKEIAQEVDFIGGGLKAGSDYDFTLVSGSALSKYAERLIDVISDVVLNPSFPDDELTLKKTNLLQELVMKRSEPDFLMEERFSKVVFGNHPYSVIAPTPESVGKMNRQALKDFHAQHYLPNEAVLIVVGDFQVEKMEQLIKADLGSKWKAGKMPVAQMPIVPDLKGRRIFLVDRPGSVQASLKLGNVAIKKTDPDYFPFLIANQILGGAAHSRLFLNIREQKGYTYGAYSGFAARKQPGAFAAEAEVRTEVTSPSIQEFLYELDRIRNVKVADKELQDAKTYLSGSYQLGLETQAGLAQRLLESQLYELPKDYLETYTSKISAVTADDIRRAAHRFIGSNDLTIVVVGDAAKIKSDLEYYAPVEVYDTKGQVIKQAVGAINKGS